MKTCRKDFPFLEMRKDDRPLIYLDNASTSQKPCQVIDALTHAAFYSNANPGRAIYALAEESTRLYENARAQVAAFIGAQPREVVFTRGTTEGINAVAQGWGRYNIKKGQSIVLSELEHHSNIVPWQILAQEVGAQLRFIPVLSDGMLDMHSVDQLIDETTALVSVTHSSNAIGSPVDVQSIIARAHAKGARVLIDACQTVPHQLINVALMQCDFLVFSGHKMLGPTGIGVLYINHAAEPEVRPFTYGGGAVTHVTLSHTTLREAPYKFEAGTPSFIQAIGLAAAITYITERTSFSNLKTYEASLCAQLIDGLSSMKSVTIYGPQDVLKTEGHIVTFTVDGIHAHDVAAYLDTRGVCVRAGHFCAQPLAQKLGYDAAIRVSVYCYNTPMEIEYLVDCLSAL